MILNSSRPKTISDPLYGIIDIRPFLPIIETEPFQLLREKRQLGMSCLVFPQATHTRLAHSFGSGYATEELCNRWVAFGFITEEQGKALVAYAYLHDIGHPPFSHVTEPLCKYNNDEMTREIISGLARPVAQCGVNFDLLWQIAAHENPLYLAVHDRNIGMEKLDYLERDGLHTILSRPTGLTYLRKYIYWIDGKLTIDEKAVDYAIEAQTFYLKMYKNVYLAKGVAIAQRMVQKMVHHLVEFGDLDPEDLPHLTDGELMGIMRLSSSRLVRSFYYPMLRRRDLFREAIVIRPEAFVQETRTAGKDISVFGVDQGGIDLLLSSPNLRQDNYRFLEQMEANIAQMAGIPNGFVLVVPVFTPGRFQAKDIWIYESDDRLHSLRERRPKHFDQMEELGRSYFALRICAPAQYRERLSESEVAKQVFNFVMSQ